MFPRLWHIRGGVGSKSQDSKFPAWCLCHTEYETVVETGKNKDFLLNKRHKAGLRVDGSEAREDSWVFLSLALDRAPACLVIGNLSTVYELMRLTTS